jgi:hypothetical protein
VAFPTAFPAAASVAEGAEEEESFNVGNDGTAEKEADSQGAAALLHRLPLAYSHLL